MSTSDHMAGHVPGDLYGLLLAGGQSRRMGRDKALLDYHGESQLSWAYRLMSGVCREAFVSVSASQRAEPERARFPQLVDTTPDLGPAGGILTAFERHPDSAWLVLACDLPLLRREVLDALIEARDKDRIATAYRSAHDALPEPLCAIWEPAGAAALRRAVDAGRLCPRKTLIEGDTRLLDPRLPDSLDNANTPDESAAIDARLRGASAARETPA